MAVTSWIKGLVGSGAGVRKAGKQTGEVASYSSKSAAPVTQDSALCLSAFWACVRLISESIASMPVYVYRVGQDGGRTLATDHWMQQLFAGKANRYQTRFEFFETLAMQLTMHGNAYVLKQTNPSGQIIGLLPLMSSQMNVDYKGDASGDLLYTYKDGQTTRTFAAEKIWHIKGMGNGIIGLSPLSYARNSLGIGIAADNRTSKIFANGAKPAAVLTTDKALTPDQRAQLKNNFAEMASGTEDTLFALDMGFKYEAISLSPKDVELLESRRFQIEDVARFMNVPSVLINDTASTTVWGSGIEQIVQGFYKMGLRPHLERIEASMVANLLRPEERGQISVEFDFNTLLRADWASRIKTLKEAVTGGIYTPDEARAIEQLASIDGGNQIYMQQQMVPLRLLAEGKGLNTIARASNDNPPTA